MGMGMESYKDLVVWQKAMLLVKEIYAIVKLLPKEEQFALSDQMRRAVVSIPSNIAEGYGRNSTNDYIRFLNIARGSKYELDTQIQICVMLNYISKEKAATALELSEEIGRMINALIKKLMPNP
jgi:four helix bundle protein